MSRQYDSDTPSLFGEPSPKSTTTRSSSRERTSSGGHEAVRSPVPEGPPSSPQSPHGVSSSSEGYPSWLPKRPPPPGPQSTVHSEVGPMLSEAGPSNEPYMIGRRPTPRSVRIVSLQGSTQALDRDSRARREPTDQSRVFSGPPHARVWSRATSAGLSPTLFGSGLFSSPPRPRFRTPGFRPELLRNPSWKVRLLFYIFPVIVFGHIALQTFFDINAVYMLIMVAKYPNPAAPGVAGSGKNWALAAAGYIACWFTWIFVVVILYELIFSFYRRWRVKRPLMLPIYMSTPAYNLVSMTSYTNFCFMYHIRASAFSGEHGATHDGLAETAYYYSQNWPTIALLLPRAALSLALLLGFWTPSPGAIALNNAGISVREGSFFRADGTLTDYARGVLIANAVWTAWRILILLLSFIGLWIASGQGCAGLCGPRFRWEEEDAEKTASVLSDKLSDMEMLPWSWKESTLMRIKDAHDFCLTNRPIRTEFVPEEGPVPDLPPVPFEGMDRLFAAVGLAPSHHPARRGVLSSQLFQTPEPQMESEEGGEKLPASKSAPELSRVAPPPTSLRQKEKRPARPLAPFPTSDYPFTGSGAQISSEENVPFPPSSVSEEEREVPIQGTDDDEMEEGEDDEEEHASTHEDPRTGTSENVATELEESVEHHRRRTSESMSSLGRPIVSRYPFMHRRPTGGSASSVSPRTPSSPSTQTRSTHTQSMQSRSTRESQSTQSTGNAESSESPISNRGSNGASPSSSNFSGSAIPMPPRHPRAHRRARTRTISPGSPGSISPVVFPADRPHARTRTDSVANEVSMTFGAMQPPVYDTDEEDLHEGSLMDVPEAEGSVEEAERQDSVGLLSAAPSPRSSSGNLRRRTSSFSQHRSSGSRSHSGRVSLSRSRSRTSSGTSRSESARSRAHSLIQSIGAASRSSIDVVRSRTNSMARLSDSPAGSSASDTVLSSPENHTFGHPLRERWGPADEHGRRISPSQVPLPPSASTSEAASGSDAGGHLPRLRGVRSSPRSSLVPSQRSRRSQRTERLGVHIPEGHLSTESQPGTSTAQSFMTAPTIAPSATETSIRTSWAELDSPTTPGDPEN
ncbi:uncharacterized protein LAESUDRAFT_662753 [Laetiporus sulphureus 93-53]|uniref:Proteophosphoglycan ppg4 n=1 Tax=Laetiporus sulphureus 93-53 TaxID=1314785 RepID=A0A165C0T5_9APHY|nr:uncharacterized protein LAESUDRAFT_662753 [Laetiporus sulphureus 93-53]KZT01995.1 hypothetical protein LAESUDRAFT_662753 [Laetiporus sulphureus 93-53]